MTDTARVLGPSLGGAGGASFLWWAGAPWWVVAAVAILGVVAGVVTPVVIAVVDSKWVVGRAELRALEAKLEHDKWVKMLPTQRDDQRRHGWLGRWRGR